MVQDFWCSVYNMEWHTRHDISKVKFSEGFAEADHSKDLIKKRWRRKGYVYFLLLFRGRVLKICFIARFASPSSRFYHRTRIKYV